MSSESLSLTVGSACEGLLQYLTDQDVIPASGADLLRTESLAILRGCASPVGATAQRTGLVCGYVQSGKTVSIETVSALAKEAPGSSQTLFITVMKNVHHLRPLAELLRYGRLEGIPALIFDDEADQASLNTRPRDPSPSPVYESLEELRAALPHHTLLQYTATPQAPLLISRIDSLSADFAELVSPGEGYAGGNVFFKQRPELIATIPGTDIFEHTSPPKVPPQSLTEALQIFFVGVAARYVEGAPTGNRSMLIHPHQRQQMHATYLRWAEAAQANWVRALSSTNDPDRAELKRAFFLDSQLRATRHNIMRQLYQRPNLGGGWFEQKVPHAAPNGGARNTKLVNALHQSLTLTTDATQRHQYADVDLKDILENFLIPFSCPDDRDATAMCAIQLTLADEAARGDASPCRVIFMDRLDPEPRLRTERGGAIDLQQGRSSGREADRYPGDRHLPINSPDRVTLQIHLLQVIMTSQTTSEAESAAKSATPILPALAIYLPPRLVKDIIVQPNN
jgi:hypothetical protein